MTLLEVVVVTVLLAMVWSLGVAAWSGLDRAHRLTSTAARVVDADRMARTFAQRGTRSVLSINEPGNRVAIKQWNDQAPIVTINLNRTVRVELIQDGSTRDIAFDTAGRTKDYRITITDANDGNMSLSWMVTGMTGAAYAMETGAP